MAKKTSRTAERIKKQREKVLEYLAESGNVSYACKRVGVSREIYCRWRADNEGFLVQTEKAVSRGKEFVNDLAHTKLMQSIQNDHFPAIKFQLASCHDDFLPKKSVQAFRVSDIPSVNIWSIPAVVELEEYRESLKKEYEPIDEDESSS
jgi:hypothetical protein